jgi:hypothetical protein
MGVRGDRERALARWERDGADREQALAEQHDHNELTHRRAKRQHDRAAAVHERAARLFDAHDDPTIDEDEATRVADEVIRGIEP